MVRRNGRPTAPCMRVSTSLWYAPNQRELTPATALIRPTVATSSGATPQVALTAGRYMLSVTHPSDTGPYPAPARSFIMYTLAHPH